jgi:hypothetical protein
MELDTTPYAWSEAGIRAIAAPNLLVLGDCDGVCPSMRRALGAARRRRDGRPIAARAVLPGTSHVVSRGFGLPDRAGWLLAMIGSFLDPPDAGGGVSGAAAGTRDLADGNEIPLLGWVSGRSARGGSARTRCGGRWRRGIAISTRRRGVPQRGEPSPRPARQRPAARRGVHHDKVLSRPRRTRRGHRGRRPSAARSTPGRSPRTSRSTPARPATSRSPPATTTRAVARERG